MIPKLKPFENVSFSKLSVSDVEKCERRLTKMVT